MDKYMEIAVKNRTHYHPYEKRGRNDRLCRNYNRYVMTGKKTFTELVAREGLGTSYGYRILGRYKKKDK